MKTIKGNKFEFLRKYWSNPSNPGAFAGRDRLYQTLAKQYVNITKREVGEFVNRMKTQQVHRQKVRPVTIRPITAKRPGEVIQMDVTTYRTTYLLCAIDIYSRYAWVKPFNSAVTAAKVVKFIEQKIEPDLAKYGHRWSVLHTDNGTEFKNDTLMKWSEDRGVKLIYGKPYHSTSQGTIERFHKTLKHTLAKYETESNSRSWAEVLGGIVSNYNHTVHGTTGQTPAELFTSNRNPENRKPNRRNSLILQGKTNGMPVVSGRGRPRKVPAAQPGGQALHVGDHVRIPILQSKTKDLGAKGYEQQWSDEVYVVVGKTRPKKLDQPRYKVAPIEDPNTPIKSIYYRAELQKVPKNTIQPSGYKPVSGKRPRPAEKRSIRSAKAVKDLKVWNKKQQPAEGKRQRKPKKYTDFV